MKKLAQIIKDHLEGKQTELSKNIMSKISNKLKEEGYISPFKVIKVSSN